MCLRKFTLSRYCVYRVIVVFCLLAPHKRIVKVRARFGVRAAECPDSLRFRGCLGEAFEL